MLIHDPLGDALTRVRNALLRKHFNVLIPHTKLVESVINILKTEGFVEDYQVEGDVRKNLNVTLKYINGASVIRDLIRVSKPGLRKYAGYKDITKVRDGIGLIVLSTPKGIVTGENAKLSKVGGEILCKVY